MTRLPHHLSIMITLDRLELQLEQLRDTMREQNRLALLEMEPSEQELEDLTTLLGSIRSGLTRLWPKSQSLAEEYGQILEDLRDHPVDVTSYEFTAPSETIASDVELPSSPKKKVRFSSPSSDGNNGPVSHQPIEAPVQLPDDRYRDDPEVTMNMYHDNQELILDQDRRLGSLSHSIGQQRRLGESIDEELQYHIDALDDIEAQTDRSQRRIDSATERTTSFNRRSRGGSSCLLIAVLTLVLFILLIL